MFCTCSRICSMATFISTEIVVSSSAAELQREANTLGSKSSALELTKISVEMKVAIEQMREQVQNIE